MSKKAVEIAPYTGENLDGIDVLLYNDNATIADYTKALDAYILKGKFTRLRSNTGQCEGCNICCQERIPLTSIDVRRLKREIAPDLDLPQFFQRYTYITVEGRAVDITLARDCQDKCIFLDPHTHKCLIYEARPLVCRTYICTKLSPQASEMRDYLVNSGEDELVRIWWESGQEKGLVIHEADDPAVIGQDWPENVWTGKTNYEELKIKEILPDNLWEKVKKKGESCV